MAKEILFYKPIFSSTAEEYITALEANKDVDITVRMNCPGGDVLACYGMIAKFNEHSKGKKIKVDGQAKSCGTFLCFSADEVECLDQSEFMAHRASYGRYIESSAELFTPELKASLNKTNAALRAMIESKCTPQKFKSVTGVSLDALFSLDSRIDVNLTPEQMKKLGVVTTITPLTKEKKSQIMALAAEYGVAAFANDPVIEPEALTTTTNSTNNMATMTAAEFKAANPDEYKKIVAEAVATERTRVAAWMNFKDIDAKAVHEAIVGDKEVNMDVISAMTVKALANGSVQATKDENAEDIKTDASATAQAQETPEAKAKKANTQSFVEAVAANLNLPAEAVKL